MRFDLAMILELSEEVGLHCVRCSPDEVGLQLEPGVTLLFQNASNEDDCLIGFEGTQWHTHDGLTCSGHGHYVQLSYLDLVMGLADGTVLVCELWERGVLADRWLVHRDFADVFRYMEVGEELRIRTVQRRGSAGGAESEGD